jgi:hypothetical protein
MKMFLLSAKAISGNLSDIAAQVSIGIFIDNAD